MRIGWEGLHIDSPGSHLKFFLFYANNCIVYLPETLSTCRSVDLFSL